jgi:tRNA (mo5U34)-methyltransferase
MGISMIVRVEDSAAVVRLARLPVGLGSAECEARPRTPGAESALGGGRVMPLVSAHASAVVDAGYVGDTVRQGKGMQSQGIEERIASFPRWHYEFDLDGFTTPVFDRAWVNRHEQRKRYFFDAVVRLVGGSLAGKRVLDLGCNAGFWSLCAIESGCDFVLGVDGRQMHIDQANFVFETKGVDPDRYRFMAANIFESDFSDAGDFDIVFCLGLLYHVSKPVELMELIARRNTDLLIIDTYLSIAPGSYFEIRRESLDEPRSAVDYPLIFHPTRQAVCDLAGQFGYSVVVLKPNFTSYEGSEVYRNGHRRAFICSKQTPLAAPPLEEEVQGFGAKAIGAATWAREKAFRAVGTELGKRRRTK